MIGIRDQKPNIAVHLLPHLRGLAVQNNLMAMGGATSVHVYKNIAGLAPVAPDAPNKFDAVYVPRAVHYTGRCDFHDMAFLNGAIVGVNTRYSCLCTVDGVYSFTPIWQPPFITQLLSEDRCHLNGMATEANRIRYVSMLGQSDDPMGWRTMLTSGGILMEVPSGRAVARDLSLPHSPRVIGGRLLCLESGYGRLLGIDPASGDKTVLANLLGFAHGLVEHRGILFAATSKLRLRRTTEPLPLEREGCIPICSIAAIDAATFEILATLTITEGVEEIYDLQVLPNISHPDVRSPEQCREHHAMEIPGSAFWVTETTV